MDREAWQASWGQKGVGHNLVTKQQQQISKDKTNWNVYLHQIG